MQSTSRAAWGITGERELTDVVIDSSPLERDADAASSGAGASGDALFDAALARICGHAGPAGGAAGGAGIEMPVKRLRGRAVQMAFELVQYNVVHNPFLSEWPDSPHQLRKSTPLPSRPRRKPVETLRGFDKLLTRAE